MSDLIDRQAAIDAIENTDWYHQNANKDMVSGASNEHQAWYKADDVYSALGSVPSAQPTVNTARHGHWIYRSFVDDWIGLLYICSECRDFCDSRYRFCPSCGAKMDGFEWV